MGDASIQPGHVSRSYTLPTARPRRQTDSQSTISSVPADQSQEPTAAASHTEKPSRPSETGTASQSSTQQVDTEEEEEALQGEEENDDHDEGTSTAPSHSGTEGGSSRQPWGVSGMQLAVTVVPYKTMQCTAALTAGDLT
uniref:Uncharacterized protein n=1 Tax=Sphaerodactylus townsendi TaxID=933632 RepID=A0ACB8FYD6_9SAUR